MELTRVSCTVCEEGVAWLLPNESQRCSVCGSFIEYGSITEHPKTDAG